MFTYIYSLLFDKDLCEGRKVPIKYPCALFLYSCFSSEDLIFSLRVSPFIPIFAINNINKVIFKVPEFNSYIQYFYSIGESAFWNVYAHIRWGSQAKGTWEQDPKVNIWALEEWEWEGR